MHWLISCDSAIWVKWWSDANTESPNKDVGMYIGVYAVFGVMGSLMVFAIGWYAPCDSEKLLPAGSRWKLTSNIQAPLREYHIEFWTSVARRPA